jgi:hypothetical protein
MPCRRELSRIVLPATLVLGALILPGWLVTSTLATPPQSPRCRYVVTFTPVNPRTDQCPASEVWCDPDSICTAGNPALSTCVPDADDIVGGCVVQMVWQGYQCCEALP